mgnify:CR=1 FL=1
MFGKIAAAGLALLAVSTSIGAANAATVYDGRWSLTISTTRGACDTYNFPVEIVNGNVSFPGLVRAHGKVAKGGARHGDSCGRAQSRNDTSGSQHAH